MCANEFIRVAIGVCGDEVPGARADARRTLFLRLATATALPRELSGRRSTGSSLSFMRFSFHLVFTPST